MVVDLLSLPQQLLYHRRSWAHLSPEEEARLDGTWGVRLEVVVYDGFPPVVRDVLWFGDPVEIH
eukprot:928924-Rhodomonas_salina.1